jgi:hypothetical protein
MKGWYSCRMSAFVHTVAPPGLHVREGPARLLTTQVAALKEGRLQGLRVIVVLLQVCPAQAITIEAEEREDGSRKTTRYAAISITAMTPHRELHQLGVSL